MRYCLVQSTLLGLPAMLRSFGVATSERRLKLPRTGEQEGLSAESKHVPRAGLKLSPRESIDGTYAP